MVDRRDPRGGAWSPALQYGMADSLGWIELFLAGLLATFVLIPATLAFVLLMFAAQSSTSWVGNCRRCGYNLRGLHKSKRQTCPECGQPFAVNARGDVIS